VQTLFFIALAAAAAATLYVLVQGVIGMAQGSGRLSAARSQGLMQKRVLYQAIAILFAVLFLAIGRSG
jgi:hypothetical protein